MNMHKVAIAIAIAFIYVVPSVRGMCSTHTHTHTHKRTTRAQCVLNLTRKICVLVYLANFLLEAAAAHGVARSICLLIRALFTPTRVGR